MAERVSRLSTEKAVVIFTTSQCPMCHTVTSLLISELGVCAAVHELDKDPRGREMERELARRLSRAPPVVPVVFIGGRLVGSTDMIMSLHLANKLVPMLKAAGAIWL
jgi:glutaredoxin 3